MPRTSCLGPEHMSHEFYQNLRCLLTNSKDKLEYKLQAVIDEFSRGTNRALCNELPAPYVNRLWRSMARLP